MDFIDVLKVYGPLGFGWLGFIYVGKFILDRYDKDVDAKVRLATALDALTSIIEQKLKGDGK